MGCGPAPNTIGIGPTNIMPPKVAGTPKRTAAIMTKIIPIKIKRKPRRNSLKGVDHEMASKSGASRSTRP